MSCRAQLQELSRCSCNAFKFKSGKTVQEEEERCFSIWFLFCFSIYNFSEFNACYLQRHDKVCMISWMFHTINCELIGYQHGFQFRWQFFCRYVINKWWGSTLLRFQSIIYSLHSMYMNSFMLKCIYGEIYRRHFPHQIIISRMFFLLVNLSITKPIRIIMLLSPECHYIKK